MKLRVYLKLLTLYFLLFLIYFQYLYSFIRFYMSFVVIQILLNAKVDFDFPYTA